MNRIPAKRVYTNKRLVTNTVAETKEGCAEASSRQKNAVDVKTHLNKFSSWQSATKKQESTSRVV